jgi:hypothetical protein
VGQKKGEDSVQIDVPENVRIALRITAALHSGSVDRVHDMDRGPMMAFVARWFLSLSRDTQLAIIADGQKLLESDSEGDRIPPSGEKRLQVVRGRGQLPTLRMDVDLNRWTKKDDQEDED